MAWGISPRSTVTIQLGDYNADHYLTLLFHAFQNRGWRIGYFDRDGIIGYTNISLQSYSEEVSVRIQNNQAFIKSECVGYQFFFTDYYKNEKNIELLLGEISYVEYHLQHTLTETTQELINSIPDNQFIQLDNPPLGYKEKLRSFGAAFTPVREYFITPILLIANIAIFLMIQTAIGVLAGMMASKSEDGSYAIEKIYLALGFNNRVQVLNGQVWRLLTNVFLHFTSLHIFFNMLILVYLGSLLEGKLGRRNFLLLYICTGVCGSMASVLWHLEGVSAGASGAIFGLFGVLLALLCTNFYERNARKALLISTSLVVAINILPVGRATDHAAHFGGLISGFVFGLIAYYGLAFKKRGIITFGSLAVTLLFITASYILAPRYDNKGMEKLENETQLVYQDLVNDIYGTKLDSLPKKDRAAYFGARMPAKLKKLNAIADKYDALLLPEKQKNVAALKAKIIREQHTVYNLVYKELLDTARVHNYRPGIDAATYQTNQLRLQLGKAESEMAPE